MENKENIKEEKHEEKKLNKEEIEESKKESEKDIKETDSVKLGIVFIVFIVIIILILLLPMIYKEFANRPRKSHYVPPVEEKKPEEPLEELTIESEKITNLVYPIMRNNKYSNETYYSRNNITMSDFSNNDILYNAFVHVYTGNLAPYTGGYTGRYCGTEETKKIFKARYIELRINNLFTKNTKYEYTDFTVPTTYNDTVYVGTWKYDGVGNYIYYGDCTPIPQSDIEYYDIKIPTSLEALNENKTVIIDNYIGFAKVVNSNNTYEIYSDVSMTNLVTSGTFTTTNREEELNSIAKNYVNSLRQYQYTFSKNNCSYENYCFEEGKWK